MAIVLFICAIVALVKAKQSSEKAWEKVLGDATSYKTFVELTDDVINFKREGFELPITNKLSEIKAVEKFGSTIVILFSNNTSMTLSAYDETSDEKLLATQQICNKRASSQKSFVGKTALQLNICTFILAIFASMVLSGAFTFSTNAWIQYSYIMYFFAIIPLIVFVASIILKSKKGRTSAIVVLICIALWGSFRFYFNDAIKYDTAMIDNLEQRINYQLPDAERLITQDLYYYTESIGKFSEEDAIKFENEIKESNIWMGKPKLDTSKQFGKNLDDELNKYNYCLVYNEMGQYFYGSQDNISWEYCILMAYRVDTHTFIILYDFTRV
ncbi:MAG: hypothetical protein K2M64_01145 [Clostridia bacterium]|nr:hypothetical protein [Clostridia bacterium]